MCILWVRRIRSTSRVSTNQSAGDNVIVGSYDRRLVWHDLDLSDRPYKTLRSVLLTCEGRLPADLPFPEAIILGQFVQSLLRRATRSF